MTSLLTGITIHLVVPAGSVAVATIAFIFLAATGIIRIVRWVLDVLP